MANLEQLTEQILQDARGKAEGILQEAKVQAETRINQALKESQARKEHFLVRAKNEADLMAERIISGTNLRIRDEKLGAKGQVIDKVMASVKERLKTLSADEVSGFIKNSLTGRTFAPQERLLVPEGLQDAVKAALGNVRVEGMKDLSGYIIDRNGVMENHSFETTLDYMKEDLEAQAAQILFEG
ncbi:V-type ATP synthase subunit E family protein [Proteiniclasticum sp. QWL-01]|uniref:V-type ATP synthase subunit E n=1 Tax=Proteiniclasticum sp. QWL-01 TaxID=3036945 RepID=UPI00220BB6A5|nr:V-type ATP synthase subunit E family protein [Proteiniclasticum sp. QWL-01]UUM10693.1 V-type ATP synthase subunit E family protein [Clostridiaceae bacterium HFYG-1003]WFF72023.1 V-type ATP synthase subunit E family protein [Proteiniclasticum sp. QWL-01]